MTRSMAVATTSALRSTSVPRSEWSSTDPGQPSTGRRRHTWCGTHGTAASPEMDSAPGRHRPHLRLVLLWPGQRIPAFTLIGCGRSGPDVRLITRLEFVDIQALPFGYGRGRCVTTFGREKGGDV